MEGGGRLGRGDGGVGEYGVVFGFVFFTVAGISIFFFRVVIVDIKGFGGIGLRVGAYLGWRGRMGLGYEGF